MRPNEQYNVCPNSLGTNKASQVVVLNENRVVDTQRNLLLTAWSSTSNSNWLRWETQTLKVVFVEHLTHVNVYVSQRSQIQFEDEDHAIYMSLRWVTTTCLRWEPQLVTLWLYPVKLSLRFEWMDFMMVPGVARKYLTKTININCWRFLRFGPGTIRAEFGPISVLLDFISLGSRICPF